MNCQSTQQHLLDLGLDPDVRRRNIDAVEHLRDCPDCREAMQSYDQLADAALPTDHSGSADETEDVSCLPVGGWAAFEARLQKTVTDAAAGERFESARGSSSVGDAPPIRLPSADSGSRGSAGLLRPWLVGGAVAASLMIGWSLRGWAPPQFASPQLATTPGTPAVADPKASAAPLASADLQQQLKVFREVDRVFDGRTGWLMTTTTSNVSDVGLTSDQTAAPRSDGKLLVVRLNLVRGDGKVSGTDLVIVPGVSASVAVPTGDATMHYRIETSAADPMQLAVRLEMPPGEESGAAGTTNVLGTQLRLQPYVGAMAGRLVTPGGTFDLNVSAALASPAKEGNS